MYTSKPINDYTAVLAHVDKMESTYSRYGISFDIDITINGEGLYRVVATAKELQKTN